MLTDEVKSGLRSGSIKPFDRAYRDPGGKIHQVLDIDEFFIADSAEEPKQDSPPPKHQTTQQPNTPNPSPPQPSQPVVKAAPAPHHEKQTQKPAPRQQKPQFDDKKPIDKKPAARIKPQPPTEDPQLERRKAPRNKSDGDPNRKYFIIDEKLRAHGPYFSAELISLYDSGRIAGHYKIRKRDTSGEVTVSQYVARKRPPNKQPVPPPQQGGYNANSLPKTIRSAVAVNPLLPFVAFILVTVISGALVWDLWLKPEIEKASKATTTPIIDTPNLPTTLGEDESIGIVSDSTLSNNSQNDSSTEPAPAAASGKTPTKQVTNPPANQSNRSSHQGQREDQQPPPSKKPPTSKMAVITPPQPVPHNPRPKTSPPGNSIPKISFLSELTGESVTVGPLQFASSSVKKCKIKCTVAMRDRFGGSIRVIFFKAAWGSKLLGKDSKVFISGIVQDRGSSIFLSDVH